MLKLFISIAVYFGDRICWRTLALLGRSPAATCVVLYYHSIPDGQRQAFADQMDVVARLTTPLSIEGATSLRAGQHYAAVTFDDGFEDVIDNAVPELEKRRIPATIFVTTAYLGQEATWWPNSAPERRRRIASAHKWTRVSPDLISIGSHTLTHPHLPSVTEAQARQELENSRLALQALLKRKVTMFSFPYGEFNDKLITLCEQAGYERIFTVVPSNAFLTASERVTGRVPAEPTDWSLEFRLKLFGAYRWLPYAMSWKRRLFDTQSG